MLVRSRWKRQTVSEKDVRGSGIDICSTRNACWPMSKMIQIRHVPDSLRPPPARSRSDGRQTLSDYLRQLLERSAEQLTPAELRERLATPSRTVVS